MECKIVHVLDYSSKNYLGLEIEKDNGEILKMCFMGFYVKSFFVYF